MRHYRGLAASPPVCYRLGVARNSIPCHFLFPGKNSAHSHLVPEPASVACTLVEPVMSLLLVSTRPSADTTMPVSASTSLLYGRLARMSTRPGATSRSTRAWFRRVL